MIVNNSVVGIVADDLTGANDTALQFMVNGADTNIILGTEITKSKNVSSQAWAISTESRNVSAQEAFDKVKKAVKMLVDEINPDYFYKKIDSTVRGNIAVEVLSVLEALEWDGAVIMPAFPLEHRITVGGYQLLRGIPIERTEMAMDPHSPISESHLPTLLKNQLGEKLSELVGSIELKTVLDGAGPIVMEINRLISEGKKIIIADAVSTTDLAQIGLAMEKSSYKILPVGNAAGARMLSDEWFKSETEKEEVLPVKLPALPKFIVSGSVTNITAEQVYALAKSKEYEGKIFVIELDLNTVLSGVQQDLVDSVVSNLTEQNIVIVHTSKLLQNFDGFEEDIANADLTKASLASTITDFLARLTEAVLSQKKAFLITLGGETSYKCCNAIGANQLKLIDDVLPAIALSKNVNSDQWIITKSGNLGGVGTLIEIVQYVERHAV